MLEVLGSTGAEASKPRVSPRPESRLLVLPLVVELLALTLFVARVALANHHDVAVATNHSALLTDGLDAWVDLHLFLFRCLRYGLERPLVTFQQLRRGGAYL